jgi:uncharacterized protein
VEREWVVINTGPLVLLEKCGALDLVGRLPYQFACPVAVRVELDVGAAKGYPAINVSWLSVETLRTPLSPLARSALDQGEAEVIQLALERGHQRVCLDDLRGRRFAMASGLQVTGVLGLLVSARTHGLIPTIKPYCERLMQSGAWYSPGLVQRILESVGE